MANRSKNLIGDVFDVLGSNTNFITPKMFTQRHPEMEVDYDRLEIRLNKKYTLKLIETV